MILLEKPSEEIIRISEDGKLLYYVVRIILNLSRQAKNIYHTKYNDKRVDYDTEKVLYSRCPSEVDTMGERIDRENREERFLEELNGIDVRMGGNYPFHENLISLIVEYGLRETSRQTGIPKSTLHDSVKKIRGHLNENVR